MSPLRARWRDAYREGAAVKEPTDREVIEAMRCFGGSFVTALAEAAVRADPVNLGLIKKTWADYWAEYTEIAAGR